MLGWLCCVLLYFQFWHFCTDVLWVTCPSVDVLLLLCDWFISCNKSYYLLDIPVICQFILIIIYPYLSLCFFVVAIHFFMLPLCTLYIITHRNPYFWYFMMIIPVWCVIVLVFPHSLVDTIISFILMPLFKGLIHDF